MRENYKISKHEQDNMLGHKRVDIVSERFSTNCERSEIMGQNV